MKKFLSLLVFISVSTFSFSQDSYMKISDPAFKPESMREKFKNYLDVLSFSYGGSNAQKDDGGGKVQFSDFNFMRYAGVNTPTFYLYMATGKVIPEIIIETVQTDGNGEDFIAFRITLSNVIVSSVQTSGSGGCSNCGVGTESVSLRFGKVKWESVAGKTQAEWPIIK